MKFILQHTTANFICLGLVMAVAFIGCKKKEATTGDSQAADTRSEAEPQAPVDSSEDDKDNARQDPLKSANDVTTSENSGMPGGRNPSNRTGDDTSSAGNKSPPPKETIEALAAGTKAKTNAKNYAKSGDYQAAYDTALAGWAQLRNKKKDDQCMQLAGELLSDLETYGEQLSSGTDRRYSGKSFRVE